MCRALLRGFRVGVVAIPVVLCSVLEVRAQSTEPVVRVEEDWVMVLNQPANNVVSPHFFTVMSPDPYLESNYAQVAWNHREQPNYSSGGLQLHSCSGEKIVRYRSVGVQELSTTAETVTWTQVLETDGMAVRFAIVNGQSTTWGTFGKDMTIDMDGSLSSLDSYNPEVSRANSVVTFGANRVDVMKIVEVRKYGASGLLTVDTTERVVHKLASSE